MESKRIDHFVDTINTFDYFSDLDSMDFIEGDRYVRAFCGFVYLVNLGLYRIRS